MNPALEPVLKIDRERDCELGGVDGAKRAHIRQKSATE
jgi:hypothetical protein